MEKEIYSSEVRTIAYFLGSVCARKHRNSLVEQQDLLCTAMDENSWETLCARVGALAGQYEAYRACVYQVIQNLLDPDSTSPVLQRFNEGLCSLDKPDSDQPNLDQSPLQLGTVIIPRPSTPIERAASIYEHIVDLIQNASTIDASLSERPIRAVKGYILLPTDQRSILAHQNIFEKAFREEQAIIESRTAHETIADLLSDSEKASFGPILLKLMQEQHEMFFLQLPVQRTNLSQEMAPFDEKDISDPSLRSMFLMGKACGRAGGRLFLEQYAQNSAPAKKNDGIRPSLLSLLEAPMGQAREIRNIARELMAPFTAPDQMSQIFADLQKANATSSIEPALQQALAFEAYFAAGYIRGFVSITDPFERTEHTLNQKESGQSHAIPARSKKDHPPEERLIPLLIGEDPSQIRTILQNVQEAVQAAEDPILKILEKELKKMQAAAPASHTAVATLKSATDTPNRDMTH